MRSAWRPVTPKEGVELYASDWVTIELLHPWYLRWLPTAKVRLMTDANGRLHIQHAAAVDDPRIAFPSFKEHTATHEEKSPGAV